MSPLPSNDDTSDRVCAIVTAAGRSSRMGSLKGLLPWGNSTLIRHQAEVLLAQSSPSGGSASPPWRVPFAGSASPPWRIQRVIVVLGHEAERLRAELPEDPRLMAVVNPRWEDGRSTSFEAAAAALQDLWPTRVLVSAVDQPLVAEVVASLLEHEDHEALLVPTFEGRAGHPVLLPVSSAAELAHTSQYPEGLRDITSRARRVGVPVLTPLIHRDLNTPQDLKT